MGFSCYRGAASSDEPGSITGPKRHGLGMLACSGEEVWGSSSPSLRDCSPGVLVTVGISFGLVQRGGIARPIVSPEPRADRPFLGCCRPWILDVVLTSRAPFAARPADCEFASTGVGVPVVSSGTSTDPCRCLLVVPVGTHGAEGLGATPLSGVDKGWAPPSPFDGRAGSADRPARYRNGLPMTASPGPPGPLGDSPRRLAVLGREPNEVDPEVLEGLDQIDELVRIDRFREIGVAV